MNGEIAQIIAGLQAAAELPTAADYAKAEAELTAHDRQDDFAAAIQQAIDRRSTSLADMFGTTPEGDATA